MKVLVTGANGHIGSHVVRELLAHNHQVRAFVRATADLQGIDGLNIEKVYGDVQQYETLEPAAQGCDTIIHLAAVYKMNAKDLDEIVKPAVEGTQNIMKAACKAGIKRVVYTSSIASIGFSTDPNTLRTSNDWAEDPRDAYNYAKKVSDQEAQRLAKQYNIDLITICPAIVLGIFDYKLTPSNKMIMDFIKRATPTFIGGNNFVNVKDVAKIHVAALTQGQAGQRYIVGGENISFKKLGQTLSKLTHSFIPYMPFPRFMMLASGQMADALQKLGINLPFSHSVIYDTVARYGYFDISNTQADFNWQPIPLEQTLQECIGWLKEQKRLK